MSLTLIIIIGIVSLFLLLLVYMNRKTKNMEEEKTNKKIKILNNKNFKMQIKKGTVIVDFWASWCAPCKMMTPILNEIAEKESERIQVAKVNVEYNQQLAKKFKVKTFQLLLYFKTGTKLRE